MKYSHLFFRIWILMLTPILFSACTDDAATIPDDDPRAKFLGTWTVEESCIRLNYEVDIEPADGDDTKVLCYNFAFSGSDNPPAEGIVNGNKITLPEQVIGVNWIISGSGTFQSNGKILWNYYIEIGANGSNCEADFSK